MIGKHSTHWLFVELGCHSRIIYAECTHKKNLYEYDRLLDAIKYDNLTQRAQQRHNIITPAEPIKNGSFDRVP